MTARILVVDDDVALAEMISIVLRGEGYVPIQAFNGKEALDLFPDAKPDLVLLDVMLPGLDGIQVCSAIRRVSCPDPHQASPHERERCASDRGGRRDHRRARA